MSRPTARHLLRACLPIAAALSLSAALASTAAAAQSATVSANWSGYAVTGAAHGSQRFSRVAGSWSQPSGTCVRGQETYSVTWVGLGGFNRGSRALEQAGTAVDCTRSGRAVYSAWYELVPQAPVTMRLDVHPGDRISSSVAQKGGRTILQVRDLSTGSSRTAVRRITAPDLSSAEWIVEAPSLCFSTTHCTPLPLTDFGTVSFSNASVEIGRAHRAAIDARTLHVTRLELRDYSQGPRRRLASVVTPAIGIASSLSAAGNAFTVTWQALAGEGEAEREGELSAPPPQGPAPTSVTSESASIRR